MTIEELAGEAGIPVSTVRLYQQRQLLDPPSRQGRRAHYGPAHAERLRLIATLQERGYSLAAIGDLLTNIGTDAGVAALLNLPTRPGDDRLSLSPTDLLARFDGVTVTGVDLARAVSLGLVEAEGERLVVSASFLHVGSSLARLGVPVEVILDEYGELRAQTKDVARRFTSIFERFFWASFEAEGMPEERVGQVRSVLGELGPLAIEVVTAMLRDALDQAAHDFMDDHAPLGDADP